MEETKNSSEEKQRKTVAEIVAIFKGEFGKIIWPSRQELIKQTGTVIITSALFGLIIFGMDTLFGMGYQLLLNLIG